MALKKVCSTCTQEVESFARLYHHDTLYHSRAMSGAKENVTVVTVDMCVQEFCSMVVWQIKGQLISASERLTSLSAVCGWILYTSDVTNIQYLT